MRQFDPIVKHLMDRFGLEFARLLFNEPGLEVLQRLDTQQSTIKVHQNDMTFKIRRANGEVLLHHIEVQTGDSTDIPMPLRVLGYASALVLRYKLPVYSMVLYLSPGAGLTDPGTYGYEDTGLGLRLNYKVIRLADLDGGPFLELPAVGLLPFTPLMRAPTGLSTDAWISACVAKTAAAPVDSETRSTLLYALSLLGSLAHDPELFQRLIPEEIMQESPFYEIVLKRGIEQGMAQGIEQGMAQGIEQGETRAKQAALLKLLQHKFQSIPQTMITQIQTIQDPDQLDAIFEKSLTAETLEDIDIAPSPVGSVS